MPEITIHDEYGVTQAMRRQILFVSLLQVARDLHARGQAMLWSEEPDGVTVYVDGERITRVLWTELVHIEMHGPPGGGRI